MSTAAKRKPTATGRTKASKIKRRVAKRGRGRGSVGREHIVEAARLLLRKVPPAKLSRKEVAAAAGVDPALVRYYFSDLRNLLTAVLKVLVDELRSVLQDVSVEKLGPQEALRQRIERLVGFLSRDPHFHALFIEQVVHGKDKWAKTTRMQITGRGFEQLSDAILVGINERLYRAEFDVRFLYFATIGASEFFCSNRPIVQQLFGQSATPQGLAAQYADFLFDLFQRGIRRTDARSRDI